MLYCLAFSVVTYQPGSEVLLISAGAEIDGKEDPDVCNLTTFRTQLYTNRLKLPAITKEGGGLEDVKAAGELYILAWQDNECLLDAFFASLNISSSDQHPIQLLNWRTVEEGWTPLHVAAAFGNNSAVVIALLRHGADVNAVDNLHRTPLHRAINHAKMVRELLSAGADPVTPLRGRTAVRKYHATMPRHPQSHLCTWPHRMGPPQQYFS